ncbi:hypothetical protein ATG66_2487 [Vibrio sp. ES.051]|nr:hypothetical protein ATG66_2487 [Vibrio sp. ES.051]
MESIVITPKDFLDLTELFFWFIFAGTFTAQVYLRRYWFGI